MYVLQSDVKLYAAAVTPEDDVATGVGGAIDLTKKFDFSDFSGPCQIVSSHPGDVSQSVSLVYRTAAGVAQARVVHLNGQTVVTDPALIGRVLKAVKSGTCAGDVALESQTAEHTGTLVGLGASADQIVLDGAASPVDGAYAGMIFRATGGTGDHEIAEIIDYVGAGRTATLSKVANAAGDPYGDAYADFDSTTVFRISRGVFFDRQPSEILYVVRMDFNSLGNAAGGGDVDFYLKGYFKHTNASGSGLSLVTCKVAKASGDARISFALDSAINGSGTNGANNRQSAPLTGVGAFGTSDVGVPGGGSLAPGDRIGLWVRLAIPAGAPALDATWTPSFQGSTA